MPEPDTNLLDNVKKLVADHYSAKVSPLLLSELGVQLHKQRLWDNSESGGRSLRQIIEAARDSDLVILRDRRVPSYIAIASQAYKQSVEQWIERRNQAVTEVPDLDALPRAVILAFCVQVNSMTCVYLRRVPPFRYLTELPEGSEQELFIPVDERYRRPGLKISEMADLSASDRLDLQVRIASWSRDKNIPIDTFYRQSAKKRLSPLERLIAAQPPGVAERMVIPGDIALLLSQQD